MNYDNSLVVTITVTCYSWAPSSGNHLFSCGAISWPPHQWLARSLTGPSRTKLLTALLPGNPLFWVRQKVVPCTKYKI